MESNCIKIRDKEFIVDTDDLDIASLNWCIAQFKYAKKRAPGGGWLYMHRMILERKIGRRLMSNEVCDHINGDTFDNRRSNLRLATISQNCQNRKCSNSIGIKGAYWLHRGGSKPWCARITVKGKVIHLGTFATPEEAHNAYCEAATKYFGEFAKFN